MESFVQPSGASIYSQDPALAARHSPGLARVSAAFVTQVVVMFLPVMFGLLLASFILANLLELVKIFLLWVFLARYLRRCKYRSPMRRILLV